METIERCKNRRTSSWNNLFAKIAEQGKTDFTSLSIENINENLIDLEKNKHQNNLPYKRNTSTPRTGTKRHSDDSDTDSASSIHYIHQCKTRHKVVKAKLDKISNRPDFHGNNNLNKGLKELSLNKLYSIIYTKKSNSKNIKCPNLSTNCASHKRNNLQNIKECKKRISDKRNEINNLTNINDLEQKENIKIQDTDLILNNLRKENNTSKDNSRNGCDINIKNNQDTLENTSLKSGMSIQYSFKKNDLQKKLFEDSWSESENNNEELKINKSDKKSRKSKKERNYRIIIKKKKLQDSSILEDRNEKSSNSSSTLLNDDETTCIQKHNIPENTNKLNHNVIDNSSIFAFVTYTGLKQEQKRQENSIHSSESTIILHPPMRYAKIESQKEINYKNNKGKKTNLNKIPEVDENTLDNKNDNNALKSRGNKKYENRKKSFTIDHEMVEKRDTLADKQDGILVEKKKSILKTPKHHKPQITKDIFILKMDVNKSMQKTPVQMKKKLVKSNTNSGVDIPLFCSTPYTNKKRKREILDISAIEEIPEDDPVEDLHQYCKKTKVHSYSREDFDKLFRNEENRNINYYNEEKIKSNKKQNVYDNNDTIKNILKDFSDSYSDQNSDENITPNVNPILKRNNTIICQPTENNEGKEIKTYIEFGTVEIPGYTQKFMQSSKNKIIIKVSDTSDSDENNKKINSKIDGKPKIKYQTSILKIDKQKDDDKKFPNNVSQSNGNKKTNPEKNKQFLIKHKNKLIIIESDPSDSEHEKIEIDQNETTDYCLKWIDCHYKNDLLFQDCIYPEQNTSSKSLENSYTNNYIHYEMENVLSASQPRIKIMSPKSNENILMGYETDTESDKTEDINKYNTKINRVIEKLSDYDNGYKISFDQSKNGRDHKNESKSNNKINACKENLRHESSVSKCNKNSYTSRKKDSFSNPQKNKNMLRVQPEENKKKTRKSIAIHFSSDSDTSENINGNTQNNGLKTIHILNTVPQNKKENNQYNTKKMQKSSAINSSSDRDTLQNIYENTQNNAPKNRDILNTVPQNTKENNQDKKKTRKSIAIHFSSDSDTSENINENTQNNGLKTVNILNTVPQNKKENNQYNTKKMQKSSAINSTSNRDTLQNIYENTQNNSPKNRDILNTVPQNTKENNRDKKKTRKSIAIHFSSDSDTENINENTQNNGLKTVNILNTAPQNKKENNQYNTKKTQTSSAINCSSDRDTLENIYESTQNNASKNGDILNKVPQNTKENNRDKKKTRKSIAIHFSSDSDTENINENTQNNGLKTVNILNTAPQNKKENNQYNTKKTQTSSAITCSSDRDTLENIYESTQNNASKNGDILNKVPQNTKENNRDKKKTRKSIAINFSSDSDLSENINENTQNKALKNTNISNTEPQNKKEYSRDKLKKLRKSFDAVKLLNCKNHCSNYKDTDLYKKSHDSNPQKKENVNNNRKKNLIFINSDSSSDKSEKSKNKSNVKNTLKGEILSHDFQDYEDIVNKRNWASRNNCQVNTVISHETKNLNSQVHFSDYSQNKNNEINGNSLNYSNKNKKKHSSSHWYFETSEESFLSKKDLKEDIENDKEKSRKNKIKLYNTNERKPTTIIETCTNKLTKAESNKTNFDNELMKSKNILNAQLNFVEDGKKQVEISHQKDILTKHQNFEQKNIDESQKKDTTQAEKTRVNIVKSHNFIEFESFNDDIF